MNIPILLYLREETVTEIILGFFLDLNYLSLISITQAKIVEFVRSKRCAIITYKHGIYELSHELPNELRLRILGN